MEAILIIFIVAFVIAFIVKLIMAGILIETLIGFTIVYITIKALDAFTNAIANSKSPLVNGVVRIAGTLAAISLAKDAVQYLQKRDRD